LFIFTFFDEDGYEGLSASFTVETWTKLFSSSPSNTDHLIPITFFLSLISIFVLKTLYLLSPGIISWANGSKSKQKSEPVGSFIVSESALSSKSIVTVSGFTFLINTEIVTKFSFWNHSWRTLCGGCWTCCGCSVVADCSVDVETLTSCCGCKVLVSSFLNNDGFCVSFSLIFFCHFFI